MSLSSSLLALSPQHSPSIPDVALSGLRPTLLHLPLKYFLKAQQASNPFCTCHVLRDMVAGHFLLRSVGPWGMLE